MGLLDDAIREHLELKRKHGADPAEVAQQEREALGPARGGAPATPTDGADAETDEPGGAVAAGLGAAAPPREEDPETALAHDAEADAGPADDIDWSEPAPLRGPADEVADEPDQRPSPAEVPPEDALESAGEPTIEHRIDERPAEGSAAPDPGAEPRPDDVLEETPEFLQETPEHDRLWFEQKPPRDFDF